MSTIPDAGLSQNETLCPFCRETIKTGAQICKHCKSNLIAKDFLPIQNQCAPQNLKPSRKSTLFLPVPAITMGIIGLLGCFGMAENPDLYDIDHYIGALTLTIGAAGLGITTLAIQDVGKGMAITGIVTGILGFFIIVGTIIGT